MMNSSVTEIEEEIEAFRRFDLVMDYESDHYFTAKSIRSDKNENLKLSKATNKKIMQEWKILEENLPEKIFVRGYERRMDLLRAVIVGAAGTPYHDGLFFFDIQIPADYPNQPPKVHYHSYGLLLNPNLYGSGYVCLSLLNTWAGKKKEKWNPQQSTILQVLVSLQALVLNDKPYFNEPFIRNLAGKHVMEKYSLNYNQQVFVRSCKTMLYVLKKPPKHFEKFVTDHFRDCAHVFLTACTLYMAGHVKVCDYHPENPSSSLSVNGVLSKKFISFKKLMDWVYPKLVTAFHDNGASVGNFIEQLKVDEEKKLSEPQGVVKRKVGIMKKVLRKMKKLFGLKKEGVRSSEEK